MNEVYMSREEYVIELEERLSPGTDKMTVKQILEALGRDFSDLHVSKGVRSNIVTLIAKKQIKPTSKGKNNLFLVNKKELIKGMKKV